MQAEEEAQQRRPALKCRVIQTLLATLAMSFVQKKNNQQTSCVEFRSRGIAPLFRTRQLNDTHTLVSLQKYILCICYFLFGVGGELSWILPTLTLKFSLCSSETVSYVEHTWVCHTLSVIPFFGEKIYFDIFNSSLV